MRLLQLESEKEKREEGGRREGRRREERGREGLKDDSEGIIEMTACTGEQGAGSEAE